MRTIILLCFCLWQVAALEAQSFQKALNPEIILYALPSELTERPDGNFVASYAIADNNGGFCMACLSPQGDPIWVYQYTYSPAPVYKMDHCATSDNGCVATMFFGNNKMIVKIDADGQVQWQKQYTIYNSCYEPAEQLVPFPGGVVIKVDNCVINFTGSIPEANPLSLLIAFDLSGNILWEKNTDKLYTLPQMAPDTDPNFILLAVASDTSVAGKGKGRICRINALTGDLQTVVVLPDLDVRSLKATASGDIYFSAQTPAETELLVGKVSGQQLQWLKRVENSGFTNKLARCSRVFLSGGNDLLMSVIWENAVSWLRFDANGTFKDAVAYTYPFVITCNQPVIQCSDGSLAWLINDNFRKEMYLARIPVNLEFNCPAAPTCDFSVKDEPFQPQTAPTPVLKTVSQVVDWFQVGRMVQNMTAVAYCPPPAPPIDPTIVYTDTVRCAGSGFAFKRQTGVFGTSFWTFESGVPASWELSSTPLVQFPGAGRYLVTHQLNQFGCTDSDSLYVRLLEPPLFEVDPRFTICPGDTVTYTIDIPADWRVKWTASADTSRTRAFARGGQYGFLLETPEGCFVLDTVLVDERQPPVVIITGDTLFCQNEPIQLSAYVQGAYTDFAWQDAQPTNLLTATETGWYIATAANGPCEGRDSLFVRAQECPDCNVFIPNSFKPDSGGENSVFNAFSGCMVEQFRLQVFDRWGTLLHQTTDPAEGWNGRSRGRLVSPGVYVFTVTGSLNNGVFSKTFSKSGDLTVFR